jgi:hypothetical protein
MPESSASAGNRAARAAWRALSSALASKVLPVSSAGAMPRAAWETTSIESGASSAANSRSLRQYDAARRAHGL